MINAAKLLADLKRLRKVFDADLRVAHAAGEQRDAVYAEWREAFDLGRTRDTFETFLDSAFDQAVVHWVLGCVFLRFLEDNLLVDRPFLSGPGERLELAKERHDGHFRAHPHDSDTEYLLAIFAEAAQLPGLAGLYDSGHNPLFRLPLSGDGAMALIRFFRERLPETGELTHDFTDPEWDTRFLGDLYQDLSEEARKRYALLQTPEFVEEWILDRTLELAIRESGHEQVTMIDPACGSGHFLLGGFGRLLREWRRFAPGLPPAEQAQRALDAIAGVDLNPFAVEIARFRLLLAALRAADVRRLSAAPNFRMHLAAGDSLLHGQHFFKRELGGAADGFRRVLRHHYAAEDTAEVDRILGQQYHVVVGNPPYITPKDPAMRDAYREIYDSCHMKYGLGVPFTERFFDLARDGAGGQVPGFVGLIVANSFMKREFGSKLIEEVLPRLDLTHVVDCSGAYIPGHGTPTVILFGRNRLPVDAVVRTVRGIRGEPSTPSDPAKGAVWTAIVAQIDLADSTSDFISTEDTPREALARHPWNMGGGGAADVQEFIEKSRLPMSSVVASIGITAFTLEDDLFLLDKRTINRIGIEETMQRAAVLGDEIRDWRINSDVIAVFPYNPDLSPVSTLPLRVGQYMWLGRTSIANSKMFGGRTKVECGLQWFEFGRLTTDKLRTPLTITFAFVATHNHFVFDRSSGVFNRSAPVIKLPMGAGDDEHIGLIGLLNSSTACFWMKQIFHNKGSTVDDKGARQRTDPFEDFYEFTGTGLQNFPLAAERPLDIARAIDAMSQQIVESLPVSVCTQFVPTRENLDAARAEWACVRNKMIALQEELDWRCYRLYGLIEDAVEQADPPPVRLGERAFEIVIARRLAEGVLETTWFERHGSLPVSEVPAQWPESYRAVVEQRIALIESDSTIGLLERPEYKRRWVSERWEDMERNALRLWLLDRLESPRFWSTGDTRLVSTNQLADIMRRDADFLSVASLYTGRPDVALEALVSELVAKEAVPFLAVLRYTEAGLRKRVQWEATWTQQRREDAIDSDVASRREEFRARTERFVHEQWRAANPRRSDEQPEPYAIRMQTSACLDVEQEINRLVSEEQGRRKREEVGDIPLPPKYVTKDFQTSDFWRLRGGLDVPKERFVSFPHCQRDADGSLVVTWAGNNHLERALAIAAYYQERKDSEGWPPERLVPLLAGVIELLPWLLQWHNDYEPDLGAHMGDYFVDFVQTEARALGMTEAEVAAWTPPATPRRGRSPRIAA
jgi:hypothetical protein